MLGVMPAVVASGLAQAAAKLPFWRARFEDPVSGSWNQKRLTKRLTFAMAVVQGAIFAAFSAGKLAGVVSALFGSAVVFNPLMLLLVVGVLVVGSYLVLGLAHLMERLHLVKSGVNAVMFLNVLSAALSQFSQIHNPLGLLFNLAAIGFTLLLYYLFLNRSGKNAALPFMSEKNSAEAHKAKLKFSLSLSKKSAAVPAIIFAQATLSLLTWGLAGLAGVHVLAFGSLGYLLGMAVLIPIWYVANHYFMVDERKVSETLRASNFYVPGVAGRLPVAQMFNKIRKRMLLPGAVLVVAICLVPALGGVLLGLPLAFQGPILLMLIAGLSDIVSTTRQNWKHGAPEAPSWVQKLLTRLGLKPGKTCLAQRDITWERIQTRRRASQLYARIELEFKAAQKLDPTLVRESFFKSALSARHKELTAAWQSKLKENFTGLSGPLAYAAEKLASRDEIREMMALYCVGILLESDNKINFLEPVATRAQSLFIESELSREDLQLTTALKMIYNDQLSAFELGTGFGKSKAGALAAFAKSGLYQASPNLESIAMVTKNVQLAERDAAEFADIAQAYFGVPVVCRREGRLEPGAQAYAFEAGADGKIQKIAIGLDQAYNGKAVVFGSFDQVAGFDSQTHFQGQGRWGLMIDEAQGDGEKYVRRQSYIMSEKAEYGVQEMTDHLLAGAMCRLGEFALENDSQGQRTLVRLPGQSAVLAELRGNTIQLTDEGLNYFVNRINSMPAEPGLLPALQAQFESLARLKSCKAEFLSTHNPALADGAMEYDLWISRLERSLGLALTAKLMYSREDARMGYTLDLQPTEYFLPKEAYDLLPEITLQIIANNPNIQVKAVENGYSINVQEPKLMAGGTASELRNDVMPLILAGFGPQGVLLPGIHQATLVQSTQNMKETLANPVWGSVVGIGGTLTAGKRAEIMRLLGFTVEVIKSREYVLEETRVYRRVEDTVEALVQDLKRLAQDTSKAGYVDDKKRPVIQPVFLGVTAEDAVENSLFMNLLGQRLKASRTLAERYLNPDGSLRISLLGSREALRVSQDAAFQAKLENEIGQPNTIALITEPFGIGFNPKVDPAIQQRAERRLAGPAVYNLNINLLSETQQLFGRANRSDKNFGEYKAYYTFEKELKALSLSLGVWETSQWAKRV
jgi:preprotein translocase subunit SecY